MHTLALRLKYAREQKSLTQEELAKKSGTTQQYIQNIEAGVVKRPRKLEAIADALDASPAWLQFGTEAIEKLDAEAISLALSWMELNEPTKSAIKNAVFEMAKKPPKKK
jgi:transcriptional regulator with XRE-family HTH domain